MKAREEEIPAKTAVMSAKRPGAPEDDMSN